MSWSGCIGERVSPRPLFAILIALAMLLAPSAMLGGRAMAAPGGGHSAQAMDAGHCDGQPDEGKAGKGQRGKDQPGKDQPGKAIDSNCCAAMCTAIIIFPAAADEALADRRMIERPSIARSGRGFLAKLPTPPPRLA